MSDKAGTMTMFVSKSGNGVYKSFTDKILKEIGKTEKIEVTVNNLSNYVEINNIKFKNTDIIKIDVEGWEINVLDGGIDFLKSNSAPTLMFECTSANLEAVGFNADYLITKLRFLGYNLFAFDSIKFDLVEIPKSSDIFHLNIIATKDIQKLRNRLSENNV